MQRTSTIRFISVDDHPAISDALRTACRDLEDLELLRSFTSLEAVPLPMRRPDVVDLVLLDLSLPGRRGLDAVVDAVQWNVPVLVFSATTQRKVVDDSLRKGARGFIGKSVPTDQVLDAIRATMRGECPVRGVDEVADSGVNLTASERHLLEFLCSDTRSKELAEKMLVSPRTIDNMVTELYRKLEFTPAERSRASLRDWARHHGFGVA